jgi:4-carboxymuconolactone decarboxylase
MSAGDDVRQRLWGPDHRRRLALVDRFEPEVGQRVVDEVFGGVYADERLELRERSLCTVAVLMVLGRERQLKSHMEAALNLGITSEQLSALAVQVSVYAGLPAMIDGLRGLDAALAERDQGPAAT